MCVLNREVRLYLAPEATKTRVPALYVKPPIAAVSDSEIYFSGGGGGVHMPVGVHTKGFTVDALMVIFGSTINSGCGWGWRRVTPQPLRFRSNPACRSILANRGGRREMLPGSSTPTVKCDRGCVDSPLDKT